jgi:TPR repeat protein
VSVALRWYIEAAMKGHVKAQLKVGRMYEEGRGRKKDDLEAFGWYLNAAKKGPIFPHACVRAWSCACARSI